MKDNDVEKTNNSGNPIFVAIIFICLIGVVFFIPDIYQFLNAKSAEVLGIGSKNQKKQTNNEPEEEAVSAYYQIGSRSTLSYRELTIYNVSLENNILKFDVMVDDIVNLDEKNYYLEFYESRSTFVGRRSLTGTITKVKNFSIDVSNLGINTSTYFVVSHISDTSIPKTTFSTDESGIAGFICKKDSLTYEYDFTSTELLRVTKKYTYTESDLDEYSKTLLAYQKEAKEYNELNGVTAVIAESNNTFIYTIELDYTDIKTFNKIKDNYIFNKGVPGNVIKFKMEAEGYDCE